VILSEFKGVKKAQVETALSFLTSEGDKPLGGRKRGL